MWERSSVGSRWIKYRWTQQQGPLQVLVVGTTAARRRFLGRPILSVSGLVHGYGCSDLLALINVQRTIIPETSQDLPRYELGFESIGKRAADFQSTILCLPQCRRHSQDKKRRRGTREPVLGLHENGL